ncbi:hypothetical protein SUDANB181_00708 [Streptomyces sp. enrichment culture]
MGERRRASSASERPDSTRRRSRSSWVRRLPIAPMYAAGRRSASRSTGTSNLGSWVRTQITVRASVGVPRRYRCGQSTTTSTPSGNRRGVANTGRASHTVTR